jgi:CheY-like chemotaxis protein
MTTPNTPPGQTSVPQSPVSRSRDVSGEGLTCPKCGWGNLRESNAKSFAERLAVAAGMHLIRCRTCRNRFWHMGRLPEGFGATPEAADSLEPRQTSAEVPQTQTSETAALTARIREGASNQTGSAQAHPVQANPAQAHPAQAASAPLTATHVTATHGIAIPLPPRSAAVVPQTPALPVLVQQVPALQAPSRQGPAPKAAPAEYDPDASPFQESTAQDTVPARREGLFAHIPELAEAIQQATGRRLDSVEISTSLPEVAAPAPPLPAPARPAPVTEGRIAEQEIQRPPRFPWNESILSEPAWSEPTVSEPAAQATIPQIAATRTGGSVLLVEPDADFRRMLKRVLENNDFLVAEADSLEAAFPEIGSGLIDVVIAGVEGTEAIPEEFLPGSPRAAAQPRATSPAATSSATIGALRRTYPGVKVVVLHHSLEEWSHDPVTIPDGRRLIVVGKPINPSAIVRQVKDLLQS